MHLVVELINISRRCRAWFAAERLADEAGSRSRVSISSMARLAVGGAPREKALVRMSWRQERAAGQTPHSRRCDEDRGGPGRHGRPRWPTAGAGWKYMYGNVVNWNG